MRDSDDHKIRPTAELFFRDKSRVFDVLVRIKNVGAFEAKDLAEFVGERIADVVGFSFECHAQNSDFLSLQPHSVAHLVNNEVWQALVDGHRHLAKRKAMASKSE